MYKKTLSVLMTLLLLAGCVFHTQAAASDTGFSDVKAGDWFADAVAYCHENGLMSGTGGGRFTPNGIASRAMLVTVLHCQAVQRLKNPPISPMFPLVRITKRQWIGARRILSSAAIPTATSARTTR